MIMLYFCVAINGYLVLRGAIWCCLGLSEANWPYLGLHGPIWGYLVPFGAIWVYMALSGLIWYLWGYLELSGAILCYLVLSGAIWGYLGLSGAIWGYLGPSGVIWCYLVLSGAIWCYPLGSGSGQTTISHCSSASIEQQNVRDHIVLHTADKRETTTSDNRAQQSTLPRHICTPAAHKKPGFFVVSRVALPSTLPPTPNKQPTRTSHRVQSALRCNVAYAQSLLGFQWCAAQRVQF